MKAKKLVLAVASSFACASFGMANAEVPYPKEQFASFVVEKLDVNSLPSAYRPKSEKGKKTFSDYGYTVRKLGEKEAVVEAARGGELSIRILQSGDNGIYACVAEPSADGGNPQAQSVILLKRKNSSELLKGRESAREFESCPVVEGIETNTTY